MKISKVLLSLLLVVVLADGCLRRPRNRAWYVDPAATGANNGNGWASAWTNFASIDWPLVAPGDTIYLSGGKESQLYAGGYNDSLMIGRDAVTVAVGQETNHNGLAILSGQYVDLGGHANVHLTGNVNGAVHLYLTDFYDKTNRTFANKVYADSTTGLEMDHTVSSNVNQAVSLVAAQRFDFHDNVCYVRGDAAVRAINCPDLGFNGQFVQRNRLYMDYCTNNSAFPDYLGPDGVQGGNGLTIRSNYFTVRTVPYQTSTQHPDYTQVIGNHIIISDNDFENIGDSANDFDWWANPNPHDILVFNNIYRINKKVDPYPEFIRWYCTAGNSISTLFNFQIIANSFINDTTWSAIAGSWGASGSAAVNGLRIANNIFYNSAFSIRDNPALQAGSMTLSNNVYAPSFTYVWRGASYAGTAMTALDPAGVAGVPVFTADFHLASTNSVGYGIGLNYNDLFTRDKDAVLRGSKWDDGAYQFVPVKPLPPSRPLPPSNLAVEL